MEFTLTGGDPELQSIMRARAAETLRDWNAKKEAEAATKSKHLQLARETRDSVASSRYRQASGNFKREQLSDESVLACDVTAFSESDLLRLFGSKSDSAYAAKVGLNRIPYSILRQMWLDRGNQIGRDPK